MGSLQLYNGMGLCRNQGLYNPESSDIRRRLCISTGHLTLGVPLRQHGFSNILLSDYLRRPIFSVPCRTTAFRCHSFAARGKVVIEPVIKAATTVLTKSQGLIQQSPLVSKLVPAVALLAFSLWGIVPLVRQGRNLLLNKKNENGWKKSGTYRVMTSYVQPLLLWLGALFICRALDLVVLPTEASKIVKDRLLNFVRSLSTVLAFAYCISSLIQQTQKLFSQTSDPNDARNMGFQFAGKAVYSAVWVAAVSLFMELLGFSTHKWLTAGGLGTVLITLAGREILTNFLSSIMIHATRPFVRNERIQIKIEGYEVSGTVEHVGWWSPTIIRGDHREAIHIPNHKFTVNVVRNITQKTHWRIKTHLAISYLDVNKINNIVADMRKVLAKNPQVEQQKLHRRIFLEDVHPENQALMILISCFVKTSHREEYLSVKEAILLDLLRVISHHRARLATPIRTIRKMHTAADMENAPFGESMYGPGGGASKRSLVVIEPSYKIYGEEKSKSQKRASKPSAEQEDKVSNPMSNETPSSDPTGTKPVSKPATTAKDTSEVSGGAEKPKTKRSGSKTKSPKRETDGSASAVSKSALEENLVLGVALEGSKRTLPIEEEIHSSPKEADAKELTGARRPGNRPLVADKEHKDGQSQTVVSSD